MPPYVPPDPVEADARRQRFVTLAFALAALVLSYLPSGGKEAMASALQASVLRPFIAMHELVLAARQRTLDVQVLQARLDSATARLAARTSLEDENRRLRALLQLAARAEMPFRSAQVLRPGTQGSESLFLLNVGADDGIPPRAPVLTREGLAGVVREVQSGSSVGMDWTHPDFRASAMSRDGLVYGFAEVRRGLFREEDRLLLSGTPYHTRLEPGAEIVTSGIGGVFPRGIPIGRVVEVAEEEGGWITSYWIEPYVHPGDVVQVVILLPPEPGPAPATPAVPVPGGEAAAADSTAYRGPDLSALWPEGETGTRADLLARERARVDSLALLRREIQELRDTLDRLRGGGGA